MEYDDHARIQSITSRWLAEWLEKCGAGLEAIEYGAGTGGFTRYLQLLHFDSLLATDVSKRMVDVGRKACPNPDWGVEDAWNPQTVGVDRIYSSNLLQWCEDPVAVLKRWRAAMKPGGCLLAGVFIEGSLREFSSINPGFGAFSWKSVEDWIQAFEQAGWQVERYEQRQDQESFPDALEALKSLHSLGAVKERRMNYSQLKQFLKCCDERKVADEFLLSWHSLRIECS